MASEDNDVIEARRQPWADSGRIAMPGELSARREAVTQSSRETLAQLHHRRTTSEEVMAQLGLEGDTE